MRFRPARAPLGALLATACLAGVLAAAPSAAVPPLPTGGTLLPAPDATADCPPSDAPLPAWAGGLTQPRDTAVDKTEHWLERPDGTLLELTVYRPRAYAGPRPTVLWYTTYSSQFTQVVGFEEGDGVVQPGFAYCQVGFYLRRGYAFVIADVRGTGDSTGCYDNAGRREQEDGRAVVDWIAAQPWSDDTVGMRGYSLPGLSQLATAAARPTALKAIVPGSPSQIHSNLWPGGIRVEPFPTATGMHSSPPAVRAGSACDPEVLERDARVHGWKDPWFVERDAATLAARGRAAVLVTVGGRADATFAFWDVWQALEEAGVPRKGIVGQWPHGEPTLPWWPLHELRWFEHHLRGIDTGVMGEPALTLLDDRGGVTTRGTLPRAATTLELSHGALVRRADAGSAAWKDAPGLSRPQLEADPTAHARWTTGPLARSATLSGRTLLEVTATLDRDDTNLVAVVYAVAPDGSRRYLTRGYLDAQLRRGLERPPVPVPVGVAQHYTVGLWPQHVVVDAGHRLELVLTSGESCLGEPACTHPGVAEYFGYSVAPETSLATVTVAEGPGLSRLTLPVAGL